MLLKLAGLLGLWLVLLALALSTGWNAVWLLVYSLGLLVAGSALWANWNVAGLELRRRHRATRVQVGDAFVEQVVLEALPGPGQWWPRLWLRAAAPPGLPRTPPGWRALARPDRPQGLGAAIDLLAPRPLQPGPGLGHQR